MPTASLMKNRSKIELAPELIEWMAERPAFLYPELLPISALKPSGRNGKGDKPYFSKAEDNLIALGIGPFISFSFSFVMLTFSSVFKTEGF